MTVCLFLVRNPRDEMIDLPNLGLAARPNPAPASPQGVRSGLLGGVSDLIIFVWLGLPSERSLVRSGTSVEDYFSPFPTSVGSI